jgi:hypothetical protein
MKIAIISDIHDNLTNLEKCLAWCGKNEIEKIICCGDITNSETLSILSKNFLGEIFLVKGNGEIYYEEELSEYKNINYFGEIGIFEMAGFKVGACHEPSWIKEVLATGHPEIIFYGHIHKPWIEEKEGIKIVNPGTLGGWFTPATFAVWEGNLGKIELKLLESI